MNPFLFALNAISPIIIMIALGYFLKKIGLVSPDMAKSLNKLVFRVFLPVMLFLNVYKIENTASFNMLYIGYTVGAILTVFLIAIPIVILFTKKNEERGVLLQASFRSNHALIGIPLATALFGDEGAIVASLLAAFAVPLFNILAVISLSVFGEEKKRPSVVKILVGIIKNPLIIAAALGGAVLLIRTGFTAANIDFRLSDVEPMMKVMNYLSDLATPLALIALGAQFEFSATSRKKREIVFGTAMRVILAPALCIGVAYFLLRAHFTGAHFAAFIAVFATPVAVSSVPMAQEMGADSELAGQLVVFTTLVSMLTTFFLTALFKSLGIF